MASSTLLGLKSHSQRVCILYKKALRNLEAFYDRRHVYRYQAVLLRARFDEHAKEPDMRKAREFLKAGEEELFLKQHPIPRALTVVGPYYIGKEHTRICALISRAVFMMLSVALSPGGVAHERVVEPHDWVLDYWHPLEKAQYPEYFKRREQRKKEFVAMWEKEYGKHDPKDSHH